MYLRLDLESSESLIHQVVEGIEDSIAKGMLLAGDRLPSADVLAKELSVHRLTVLAAYRELVRKGRVKSKPRRGTIVVQSPDEVRKEIFRTLIKSAVEKGRHLGLTSVEMEFELRMGTGFGDNMPGWNRSEHNCDLFAPAASH